jgi:hypothetical protein
MWTIAAPALAASMADVAISPGVMGTAGFTRWFVDEPVTAQVMTVEVVGGVTAANVPQSRIIVGFD